MEDNFWIAFCLAPAACDEPMSVAVVNCLALDESRQVKRFHIRNSVLGPMAK